MAKQRKKPTIVRIDIDKLIEDPENCNAMTDVEEAQLQENMAKWGSLQPPLVRPLSDGTFFILDGNHRKMRAHLNGDTELDCVVVECTEAEGKALAISMNKIRGQLDLGKVAGVFASLVDDHGWDLARLKMTGFDPAEIDDMIQVTADAVADAEEVLEGSLGGSEREAPDPSERPHVIELTFTTASDKKKARQALRRAAGKGRDLAEGLLRIIAEHEDEE